LGAHLKSFRIGLILLVSWFSTPQGVRAQAPQTPKPPVFGADVAVVAVPVFVTDKNGKAVGGLTADDFEVEDGGRKVPIVAFQAIDVDAPVTVESEEGLSSLPISVQAEGPRQFLLLLDLEFSPPVGAHRGRAAASSFIREQLAKGDLVAVAVWGRNGLKVLTNFTADHERAALALEGKGAMNTPGLDPLGLAGGFGTLAPSGARSDEMAAEIDAVQQQVMREEYATRVGGFLEDAIELVRKLSSLRGRKQLVLLSGGFRESAWNGGPESGPNLNRMRRIFETAASGDVVVHTISLGGIQGSLDLSSRTGRSDDRTANGSVDTRTGADLVSGRMTLAAISKNTGGFHIQPTNDFGRALREVDRVSRQSYVIAFEAAETATQEGKARELKVRVRRPGLSVSHRTTYRAPAARMAEANSTHRLEAAEAIAKGLTGGSLPLNVTTLPYRDGLGQPVVHAVLDIGPQGFASVPGDRPLSVEIYAYLMEEGRVLDSLAASTSLDLSKVGSAVRSSGLQVLTAFPLPAQAASLRFFVRAGESGPTGSIQQNVTAPAFASGQPVLSTPLFNLPLTGRMALPFQPKDRPRIEIPFRLGSEPFVPESGVVLKAGTVREVCVFVWPARAEATRRFEVSAEFANPGGPPRAVPIEAAPRVVADPDGFDRYVVRLVIPETSPGSYALRLTFRDTVSGLATQSRTSVFVEP
jgi:VWFA-related protein